MIRNNLESPNSRGIISVHGVRAMSDVTACNADVTVYLGLADQSWELCYSKQHIYSIIERVYVRNSRTLRTVLGQQGGMKGWSVLRYRHWSSCDLGRHPYLCSVKCTRFLGLDWITSSGSINRACWSCPNSVAILQSHTNVFRLLCLPNT